MALGILIVAQVGFTYWPAMQTLFGTVGFDWRFWPNILMAALSLFILIEIEKFIIRRILPKFSKTKKV